MYECSARQELFTFKHSHTCDEKYIALCDETRMKRVEFKIDRDCIVTGFGGYHQLHLYRDVTLSNQALIKNHNESCVPMAYFPLIKPQTLNAQDNLSVIFWLQNCVERGRFWYEWETIAPHISDNHNWKGQAFTLEFLDSV